MNKSLIYSSSKIFYVLISFFCFSFHNQIAFSKNYKDIDSFSNLPNFSQDQIQIVGGKLNFISAGSPDKPTIIFLHKLGGRVEEWRHLFPFLVSDYHLIAIDLAGHGLSKINGPPPFIATQEELSSHVLSVIDTFEKNKPVIIAGSSLGGCIAIVSASLWPSKISAVIVLGSALGTSQTREELIKSAKIAIENKQFTIDETPIERPLSYAKNVFGVNLEAIAVEMNESRKQAGQWIQPVARGVARMNYLEILPQIIQPVLLVDGKRGNYGRFHQVAFPLLKDSRSETINKSGSFPHEEKPEETSQIIKDFLSSLNS